MCLDPCPKPVTEQISGGALVHAVNAQSRNHRLLYHI